MDDIYIYIILLYNGYILLYILYNYIIILLYYYIYLYIDDVYIFIYRRNIYLVIHKKSAPEEILISAFISAFKIVCLVCNFAQLLPIKLSKRLKCSGRSVEKEVIVL